MGNARSCRCTCYWGQHSRKKRVLQYRAQNSIRAAMAEMLRDSIHADIKILSKHGEASTYAHSAVLATMSPVLKSILRLQGRSSSCTYGDGSEPNASQAVQNSICMISMTPVFEAEADNGVHKTGLGRQELRSSGLACTGTTDADPQAKRHIHGHGHIQAAAAQKTKRQPLQISNSSRRATSSSTTTTRTLTLEDISSNSALRAFLRVVYLGELHPESLTWENALEVLAASHRYELPSAIRAVCASTLSDYMLTQSNCLQILEAADSHRDEFLLHECRKYAAKHLSQIVHTQAFHSLAISKPSIIVDLLRSTCTAGGGSRRRPFCVAPAGKCRLSCSSTIARFFSSAGYRTTTLTSRSPPHVSARNRSSI